MFIVDLAADRPGCSPRELPERPPSDPNEPETVAPSGGAEVSSDPAQWRREIEAASLRLKPYLVATPAVRSAELSRRLGRPVYLKLETQQPVAAFKVRPAFNSILAKLKECRESGVVANSSGNFAQAVAYAASRLKISASIVMMKGASPYKRERTRRLGATVIDCENSYAARTRATERVRQEEGRILLHPFDTVETIAGNATLGAELRQQVPGDITLFAPVSGGGLISGAALALKAARPHCRIIGVQSWANPATKRSLEEGRPVRTTPSPSLADALTVPTPGALTFPIIREHVVDVVLVSESQMADATRWLALEQKLVVEPSAAATVAALLAQPPDGREPVVCVLSGGNIGPDDLRSILAAG